MKIPKEVENIIEKLQKNGFEAYVVGGCVRDLILLTRRSLSEGGGREATDWDIATSAKPEEIQKIFPDSFYENKFLTVTVKTKSKKESLKEIEITTFRSEAKYSDKRHPDEVKFAKTIEEDLGRRDFTVNAIALSTDYSPLTTANNKKRSTVVGSRSASPELQRGESTIIDPFHGQKDLEAKIIRAVGNPEDRFNEDALRMMRAVRFACQLNFTIEPNTFSAVQKNAGWISAIAKERIRDELIKIIMSDKAADGIELLKNSGLLKYIMPELEKGIGVSQNRHHIYTVYEHNLLSLKFAAQKKFNLEVRLASLLHDIAKQEVKEGEGPEATFYNHDFVGAKFAVRILERLRFSNEIINKVALLIRSHMFVYDVGVVTEAGIRRLLKRVGPENMQDLIDLRIADRLGSGVPKAQPYRLRHFQYMVEKVQHDAISVKMLKINGNDIMKILEIPAGPKIGAILDVLLADAIEEPEKNEKKYLEKRVKELAEADLTQLRQMAKQKIEEKKEEEDLEIKGKYWVR